MRRVVLATVVLLALLGGSQIRAAVPPPLTGWLSFGNGAARTGSTSESLDLGSLGPEWFRETGGMVTTQPLIVHGTPARDETTAYVATTAGRVIAYAPDGYVRWQRTLGAAPNPCPQLTAYGIVGTPVVDATTRALYVADGFGLLHALDLVTGRDHAGWPVQLYGDSSAELVWGALADVGGSIYVGTGSYCDRPMEGKLIRVQIATRRVSSWTVVPEALGGGGSIWGWGGPAYSKARNSLFVVTGNAFEGGTNTGASFDEAAGYGEHLVELSPSLQVIAASHPDDVRGTDDFDFVGSPVVFTPPACGELVAAANKNGRVFLWRTSSIETGPVANVAVQAQSLSQPLLTQPAYDPKTRSLYVVTFTSLVRIVLDGCAGAHVAWEAKFPHPTLHGSPTVAGTTVWVALSGSPARIRGYDTVSGRLRYDRAVGGMSFAPPVMVGGRLFEGAEHGLADRSARVGTLAARTSPLRAYTSWSDKRHAWQSRESGVYATDDGGRTWRKLYPTYAQRVLRLSAQTGVISVGAGRTGCDCRERQLWTGDGGRTWHETRALGPEFTGSGRELYSWSGEGLRRAAWPPTRSAPLAVLPLAIADAVPVPGGVATLLTAAGRSWDNAARITILRGDMESTVSLPATAGRVLARSLTADWPRLVVRTYVFTDRGRKTVRWRSANGGESWQSD